MSRLYSIPNLKMVKEHGVNHFSQSLFYEGEHIEFVVGESVSFNPLIVINYRPLNLSDNVNFDCITDNGIANFNFVCTDFIQFVQDNGKYVEVDDLTPQQKKVYLQHLMNH